MDKPTPPESRFAPGQECEHGQLARSCDLCDRDYEIAELRAQVADLRKENDRMRASLANGGGPCSYCKLPREQWASCARGFPGCPRGDDAMLCPHVGAGLREEELRAQVAQYESAIKQAWSIIDPFNPVGQPGSYARGYENGTIQTLQAIRAAIDKERKGD